MKGNGTLVRLKAQLKRHGITQETVAHEAGVTRPLVVNVFAGRSQSQNVLDTSRRLIAEAKTRKASAA